MGRGRIPMELIENEKARKITFQKRKKGLMKKVYEFSTLCDVDACLIINGLDFEGEGGGVAEPAETWPKDIKEVQRIIQKYYNTTNDRRPKTYDVEEYYKERMKKVEAEVAKVHKETLKVMYPTWNDSFNTLGEEELRMFASTLDAILDACNQKVNMQKGDPKSGSSEINMLQLTDPFLASNSHFNINMQNNMNMLSQSQAQAQLFPPLISCDLNIHPLVFWQQFQMGQASSHSQPPPSSMLHFGQNGMTDWANQVGAVTNCDPKIGMMKEINDNSSSPYYYNNGHTQTLEEEEEEESYSIPSQTLSNLPPGFQFQTQTLPPASSGFQLNGFYDTDNIYQAHMFNYMHGRKE